MRLTKTARFERAWKKLPDDVKGPAADALRQFMSNPRHPSLHFEKLSASSYRTIRVDAGRWRIVLRGIGSDFDLIDIDRHGPVDRKYG